MLLQKKSAKNHHPIDLAPDIVKRSQQLLPIIGYFILLIASIDYLFVLVPLHLFDTNWVMETIGSCVNRIWSLLLGLVMVFAYRSQVKLGELKVLAWLSRLVLIVAIVYFLAFPLAVTNSLRIHRQNVAVLNSQLSQQSTQYQQQKKLLDNATSDRLAQSLQQRNKQLSVSDRSVESPQELKQRLTNEIKQKFQQNQSKAKANLQQKKWSLIKTAVKYSIGTIISGVMLVWVWILTDWTRKITTSWQQES